MSCNLNNYLLISFSCYIPRLLCLDIHYYVCKLQSIKIQYNRYKIYNGFKELVANYTNLNIVNFINIIIKVKKFSSNNLDLIISKATVQIVCPCIYKKYTLSFLSDSHAVTNNSAINQSFNIQTVLDIFASFSKLSQKFLYFHIELTYS